PGTRDHRERPRRPQGLRAGAHALGSFQRQRCLARLRGHGLQPHPRRRDTDEEHGLVAGDHGNDPPQAHQPARPRCLLRSASPSPPAPGLAMAEGLVRVLRRRPSGSGAHADLTTRRSPYEQESQWKGRADRRPLRALAPAPTSWPRQRPPQQLIGGSRLISAGHSPAAAGVVLGVCNGVAMLAALLVPVVAARRTGQGVVGVALAAASAAGLGAVLLLPGAPAVTAILLGVGQGGAIGLALLLVV